MTRLYVVPGHGMGDPGAMGHGYSEAERVRELATRIKHYGGDNVILADFNENYYMLNKFQTVSIPSDCCVVELHMDSAGTPSAHGGHVITGIRSANAYDHNLANLMMRMFPGRAAHVVQHSDLRNPNVATARGINYRLVENGFISNADDVWKFNTLMDELALGYLEAFGIRRVDRMAMAPVTVPEAGSPVYRLYNPNSGEHFYTASEEEKEACVNAGWTVEGTAWNSPKPETAVYRLHNPNGYHHFTADFDEATALQKAGWEYEGVQFFASKNGDPVWCAYNPNTGDHLLTTDSAEVDELAEAGWIRQGASFHIHE